MAQLVRVFATKTDNPLMIFGIHTEEGEARADFLQVALKPLHACCGVRVHRYAHMLMACMTANTHTYQESNKRL